MMMLEQRNGMNNSDNMVLFVTDEPNDVDVLCGKDKTYAKHPGNILYRNLIQSMSILYAETPTKQEKMRMTAEIVHKMKIEHGSRFLKSVSNSRAWCNSSNSSTTAAWEEISVTAARDKTSHALRFCAANQHHHASSSGSATSATTASIVTPNPPSSRRSLRALAQRRAQHRRHRRTVSSEKAPLLPYSASSNSEVLAYDMTETDVAVPLETYSSHFPSLDDSNLWYDNALALDDGDDGAESAEPVPDAVVSYSLDGTSSNHHGNHHQYHHATSPIAVSAPTATASVIVVPPNGSISSTTTNDSTESMVTPLARSASKLPAAQSFFPSQTATTATSDANQETEDLDAILREPLNWEAMEDDDLFFL